MSSSNAVPSRRTWGLRVRSELLAISCALVASCAPGDDPFALPDEAETGNDPESAATDPGEGAVETTPSSDAARVRPPGVDAGQTAGGSEPPGPDAGAGSPGNSAPSSPTRPGNVPSGASSPGAASLDAGDLTFPTLTDDAGVSLACAAEFSGCVLLNTLEAGPCLDAYAECEPGFRGDGGFDGTCAVHFSACVLADPLGFESCFEELTGCEN